MPETTPAPPKAPFGQSLAARAAAAALAVALAVFLAAYLMATLPDRLGGWQTALPTRGMSEVEAASASLRARYLHEAEIRPRLVRAGFLSPQELDSESIRRYGFARSDMRAAGSDSLLGGLWAMRAFPELHAAFLTMLLDRNTPPNQRAAEFYLYSGFLAAVAEALADDTQALFDIDGAPSWHDIHEKTEYRFARYAVGVPDAAGSGTRGESPVDGEMAAFARDILPLLLESLRADARNGREREARKAPHAEEAARERGYVSSERLTPLAGPAGDAVRAMWRHRADAAFLAQARQTIAAGDGPLSERLGIIPLMAEKPGLPTAEYRFLQTYAHALRSIADRVGMSPRHYGYILTRTDGLTADVARAMNARGTFTLGGQTGPGVTMARTDSLTPARAPSGSLYLLADMEFAMKDAPEYDLSRAVPVFRGTMLRHMINQPLVLPLNPEIPGDAAVIAWYDAHGWEGGHTLLFSAAGSPETVARHWASLMFVWWPDKKAAPGAEPDLAYCRPISGHFMSGMLPVLKGEGVTRFLGPVTALWFGRWNVDKTGWTMEKYEARPEAAPVLAAPRTAPLRSPIYERLAGKSGGTDETRPVLPDAGPPAILMGKDALAAMNAAYSRNYRVTLARHLNQTLRDEDAAPLDIFSFTDNAVTMLNEWGIIKGELVNPATELLWRFRGDPAAEKQITAILSQKDRSPRERLRAARRALGLPATAGDGGN